MKNGLWLTAGLIGLAVCVSAKDIMISTREAIKAAQEALHSGLIRSDPLFTSWADLTVSEPYLVAEVTGAPSYWVVPLVSGHYIVGFARVMSDGTVAAIGITCTTPEAPEKCPTPTVALSPVEMETRLRTETIVLPGETLAAPVLVHDGPPGREVWMSETRRGGRPNRWIFIAAAGTYERSAGTILGTDPQVE